MGASNVAAVWAHWTDLTDQPLRLLLYMAHSSMDVAKPKQPARRYWGGRDALAEALRGPKRFPPKPPDSDRSATAQRDRSKRSNAHAAVQAALRVLIDEGAVTRLAAGHVHRNSEYELHLGPRDLPEGSSESTPEGSSESTPEGSSESREGVDLLHAKGSSHSTPKENRGGLGTPQETNHLPASTHQAVDGRCLEHDQTGHCTTCADELRARRTRRGAA